MGNRQNTFLLKRSSVTGKKPTNGQILLGELAINTADVILYASGTTSNSILPIGWDRISRTGDTMTGTLITPTISATTYQNLPKDIRLTGGTYSAGTTTFSNNTGGTFSISGYQNLDISIKEDKSNKVSSFIAPTSVTNYPNEKAVTEQFVSIYGIVTKTGVMSTSMDFKLIAQTTTSLRISDVNVFFYNELTTQYFGAIKNFPIKDYPLTQLITATGGNVNQSPIVANGIYYRAIGYDKNQNIYTSDINFSKNNDIAQLGYVIVIKNGSVVTFVDGTIVGAKNAITYPYLASITDIERDIIGLTSSVSLSFNSSASMSVLGGVIKGIGINWNTIDNPSNINSVNIRNVNPSNPMTFELIFPGVNNNITPQTDWQYWSEVDNGITINSSYYNTNTNTRQTLSNNRWSVKRIIITQAGRFFIQDGEHPNNNGYQDKSTAQTLAPSMNFTDTILPFGTYLEIGRVIFKKGVTNLNDYNQAQYIPSSSSGGGVGGGDMNKSTYDIDNDGIVDLAESVVTNVYLDENVSIGDPIYISSVGTPLHVSRSKTNSPTTLPAIGIMLESGLLGDIKKVSLLGKVTGVNTNGLSLNQILYVAPTGGFTNIKPPTNAQVIGVVFYPDPVNGVIGSTPQPLINDAFLTGGTYNNTTGTANFVYNSGGSFNVTGFTTGGGSGLSQAQSLTRISFGF